MTTPTRQDHSFFPELLCSIKWLDAGNFWLWTNSISKSKSQLSSMFFKSTVLTVRFDSTLYDFTYLEITLVNILFFAAKIGLILYYSWRNFSSNNPRDTQEYKDQRENKIRINTRDIF